MLGAGLREGRWRAQVYTFIMQELVKYRGMYTSMAELLKSGAPGPDLHAHHDLLASALPQGSNGQVRPRVTGEWCAADEEMPCMHAPVMATFAGAASAGVVFESLPLQGADHKF